MVVLVIFQNFPAFSVFFTQGRGSRVSTREQKCEQTSVTLGMTNLYACPCTYRMTVCYEINDLEEISFKKRFIIIRVRNSQPNVLK